MLLANNQIKGKFIKHKQIPNLQYCEIVIICLALKIVDFFKCY